MSDFKFNCPHCEQPLEAPEDLFGQTIECPTCNKSIQMPRPASRPEPQRTAPKKRIITRRFSSPFRRTAPPAVSSPQAMPNETFGVRQIVGVIGAVVLFVGVFAPIVSVPIVGNMNYFQNGKGDGTIVLILAILSVVAVLAKKDAMLFFTSIGCLVTLTVTFVNFRIGMSRMLAEASSSGGLLSGLVGLAAQAVQLQWGWALLVVGACLTLAPIFIKATPEDSSQREFFKLAAGWRFAAGVFSGLCCVAAIGAIAWPASPSGEPSSPSSTPHSATALSPEKQVGWQPRTDALPTVPTSSPEKQVGWQLRTNTSPIDDSRSYFLSRDAEEPVGSGFMRSTPTLMIRHKEGDLEVYITFRDYLGSDTTMVTMRLGTSPASQSKWGVSTDGKAIFYPADNNEFVKQLLENERLVIRLTPYGESPITSTFDLKGLKEAIEPMKGLIR